MIAGIVLAAGRSSRMGRPKALLETGEGTFVERAVTALRDGGCNRLVVVVPGSAGSDPAAASVAEAAGAAGADLAFNGVPRSEQIDSLRAGIGAVPLAEAIVVLPVDVPLSGPAAVAAVIGRFRATHAPVVVALHAGRRGHPVLFGRAVFGDLHRSDLSEGARSAIELHEAQVVEASVDDPGVLLDIDRPEDYRRLMGPDRARR